MYIIISLRPHLGDIGLHVNVVVSDVPAADHKRVQGNGFCPQHGGAMTSMHKIYYRCRRPYALPMLPEFLHVGGLQALRRVVGPGLAGDVPLHLLLPVALLLLPLHLPSLPLRFAHEGLDRCALPQLVRGGGLRWKAVPGVNGSINAQIWRFNFNVHKTFQLL